MIFKIKAQEVLHFLSPLYLLNSEDFGILFWFSAGSEDLVSCHEVSPTLTRLYIFLNFFSEPTFP